MRKSVQIRIDCKMVDAVNSILKKYPFYGTKKKFLEFCILQEITKIKRKGKLKDMKK